MIPQWFQSTQVSVADEHLPIGKEDGLAKAGDESSIEVEGNAFELGTKKDNTNDSTKKKKLQSSLEPVWVLKSNFVFRRHFGR